MPRKSLFILLATLAFAFVASSCSKKQTVSASAGAGIDTQPVTTPAEPAVEDDTSETATGDAEVREVRIPVLEDVFFDFDKSSLTDAARRLLESNARQLKDAPSVSITIEGHCDERGTNSYNLALGEKRAQAAKAFLTALGVSGGRIKTVSMGEEHPFDRGHNESAWAKNRRAHFVVNN